MHTYKIVLLFACLILLSPFCSVFALTEVTDDITADTTWTKANSPYVIKNSVAILDDVTLTIEPGVVVKFEQGISISVFGNLISAGTASKPITFTSIKDDSIGGDTNNDDSDSSPAYGDWREIYLESQSSIAFSYTNFKYSTYTVTAYDTDVNFSNIKCLYVDSCANLYNSSHLTSTGSTFSHIYKEAIAIFNDSSGSITNGIFSDFYEDGAPFSASLFIVFNESSLTLTNPTISGFHDDGDLITVFNDSTATLSKGSIDFSDGRDALYAFNNATLNISEVNIAGGTGNGVTMFNHAEVNLSKVKVSGFTLVGIDDYGSRAEDGYSADVLNLADVEISGNDVGIGVSKNLNYTGTNVSIVDNSTYGALMYSDSGTVALPNVWWGNESGPFNANSNPDGTGNAISDGISATPYTTEDPTVPNVYYAKITNIPGGVASLYDSPSTSGTLVKTLPNDWVVKVVGKKDVNNKAMVANGYNWYKVEDPTDATTHYMISGTGTSPTYLPYEKTKQTEYENKSVDNLSGNGKKDDRRQTFLDALDHYYNNTANTKSLYSGSDTTDIKILKNGGFSKEIILAMAAQEISGSKFNNEIVSYDYGHGMMQVTMDAYAHENPANAKSYGYDNNGNDPRGEYSKVVLSKCKEKQSDQYKKCYENTATYNNKLKLYANYDHNSANPKYKQYANTVQSVYANIKDGLGILVEKYKTSVRNSCEDGDYVVEGYTFTCSDLINIKTVWFYNGMSFNPKQTYMKDISDQLKVLNKTFPGYTYANTDHLIEKLEIANRHRLEIKQHSPVEMRVKDSAGNTVVGMVNGQITEGMENVSYDEGLERAVIFFPTDTYTYEVVGDSSIPTGGTYGLDINTYSGSDTPVTFNAVDIPITTGETHTFIVDNTKLANNEADAVTIKVDANGDGTPERTITTGATLDDLEAPKIDMTALQSTYVLGTKLNIKDFITDNQDKTKKIIVTAKWVNDSLEVKNNKILLNKLGAGTLEVKATDSMGNTNTATKSITTNYTFKGFKSPLESKEYKINKALTVRFRLASLSSVVIPLQHPTLKITRVSDGYSANINPNTFDEDGDCDADDECFTNHHNRYIFTLPKNKLSAGSWKVEVGLDDGTTHTTNLTMVQ